jgi:Peptidase M50B-like
MDALAHRIFASSTPPTVEVLAACVALAAVLVWSRSGWRVVGHAVTLVHEVGHALAAAITGADVKGITLHLDGSGWTYTRGGTLHRVVTLLSGYPAPAVAGVVAAGLVGAGHPATAVTVAAVVAAMAALLIRNLFGVVVVLGAFGVTGATLWWLPGDLIAAAVTLAAFVFAFGSLRSASVLVRHGQPADDAAALGRLTRLPAGLWRTVFVAVAAASVPSAFLLVR